MGSRYTCSVIAPEHAGIELTLTQMGGAGHAIVPGEEPWEDGTLPAPSRLRHAIDWLLHTAKALDAVGLGGRNHVDDAVDQSCGVTWGRRAVHNLSVEEVALKVCSDKVPAVHL